MLAEQGLVFGISECLSRCAWPIPFADKSCTLKVAWRGAGGKEGGGVDVHQRLMW